MKRAAAFFIEEIGYSVCMIIVLKQYTERFEGISLAAVFAIPILAFAAANILYVFLEIKLEGKMYDKFVNLGGWIYPAVSLLFTTALFFGFYSALEYLGNMPASVRTLLFISFMSSDVHLLLCEGLRFMRSIETEFVPDNEEKDWEDE